MNLTAIAHAEISCIRPRDLTNKKFSKGTKYEKQKNSPSVFYVIDSFNDRVRWVSAVLLFNDVGTPGDRAATISYWIDVAFECVHLCNYQTALVIMSAFSSPCMNIVSNGMSVVAEKQRIKFEDMKYLMSSENRYQAYRRVFSKADGKPHVPAFPVVTQDLIRLEDGSKTFHAENKLLIHISKFNDIYNQIESLMSCIKNGYTMIDGDNSVNGTSSGKNGNGTSNSGSANNVNTIRTGDGGNSGLLKSSGGLIHLLLNWLHPPPSEMELYKTASRVLSEENQNMLETLDYLGL